MGVITRLTTWNAGDVLTASALNNEFNNILNTVNGSLDANNIDETGAYTWTGQNTYTGADKLLIPATAPTTSRSVASLNGTLQLHDGTSARIYGPVDKKGAWYHNLCIVSATTTNTGDSIKITSFDGSALSSTNPGYVLLPSVSTAGQSTLFTVTADVTIKTQGAHWGFGTTGDITGGILRVLAVNDNGTLRWGVALLGGRNTLLTTDTNATATSVTLPEHVLMGAAAVGSASNTCREFGWFRSNFDDTGGAAEDLWTNQTGLSDIRTGESADGYWMPWNPTFTGFSAAQTTTTARWTQQGRNIVWTYKHNAVGTSNATTKTMVMPAKASQVALVSLGSGQDNGANLTPSVGFYTAVGSASLDAYPSPTGGSWTNSGSCRFQGSGVYEVGPAASFIE